MNSALNTNVYQFNPNVDRKQNDNIAKENLNLKENFTRIIQDQCKIDQENQNLNNQI